MTTYSNGFGNGSLTGEVDEAALARAAELEQLELEEQRQAEVAALIDRLKELNADTSPFVHGPQTPPPVPPVPSFTSVVSSG